MAWVEQCGNRSWRVRYRRDDDSIGAVPGFPTKAAATAHAQSLEVEQREGRFIDPAAGRITVEEWSQQWFAGLDVAIRTEDFDRSMPRCHILPRRAAVLAVAANAARLPAGGPATAVLIMTAAWTEAR